MTSKGKRFNWLAVLIAMLLLSLATCKPPSPAPAPKAKQPLALLVGGLGDTQLVDTRFGVGLDRVLRDSFSTLQISGFTPNGNKADLAGYVSASSFNHLILIGHSFGCAAVCRLAEELGAVGIPVDLVILIDPVCDEAGVTTMNVPANVKHAVWFRRMNAQLELLGFEVRATVTGAVERRDVPGNHNELPHNVRDVLDPVKAEVAAAI